MRDVWCITCGKRFRSQIRWERGQALTEYYLPGTDKRVKHCSACGAELRQDTVILSQNSGQAHRTRPGGDVGASCRCYDT